MTLLSEIRPSTTTRLVGPSPLLLVTQRAAAGDARSAADDGEPFVVDLTAAPASAPWVEAVTDCTVLHGWLPAETVAATLALLDLPSTLRVRAAVDHAARSIDRTAPGSAALCGLARALLSKVGPPARIAHDVAGRARRLTAGLSPNSPTSTAFALQAVATLAGVYPDDPAVVAPLFLRPRRLRAGDLLAITSGVPLMALSGAARLHHDSGDVVLANERSASPGAPSGLERLAGLLIPAPSPAQTSSRESQDEMRSSRKYPTNA